MQINHLVEGTLISRYKRFLADVRLSRHAVGASDDAVVTAHCANTGSMTGLDRPGARVWLSWHDNPRRKLPYSWELVEVADSTGHKALASINTSRANALVREALEQGVITPLGDIGDIQAEVRVGDARLDFRLHTSSQLEQSASCYVEVKQVTLLEQEGRGYFPDAVSARGLKHLNTLAALAQQGERAVLLFCVAHSAINEVRPAEHIDPAYAAGLRHALAAGVEVLAYRCDFSLEAEQASIALTEVIPVVVPAE